MINYDEYLKSEEEDSIEIDYLLDNGDVTKKELKALGTKNGCKFYEPVVFIDDNPSRVHRLGVSKPSRYTI